MFRNQRGFSVYNVLSIILFLALVFILALPSFFRLDPEKNTEDCINNMKVIWVAATDFITNNKKDLDGDYKFLSKTRKPNESKAVYLQDISYCPESGREKEDYIVFGKYLEGETLRFTDGGVVREEKKHNVGVIVVCPNLDKHPAHIIPKAFYENMQPTQLQNYMSDDLAYIDEQTAKNGKRKLEAIMQYINIWKNDATAFESRKANRYSLLARIFPEKPELQTVPVE